MNPIIETDISGEWKFTPENGSQFEVLLSGGWLKQGFDCEAGTYERYIDIPDTKFPSVIKIELGAVNHYAEYYIGETEDTLVKIYSEVTAFTPQTADLTPYVKQGCRYLLRIFVRAFENGRPIAPHCAEWCECIARGIFRYAYLRVYPEIYISDTFVKTYVAEKKLTCDIWVANASKFDKRLVIDGSFSSFNNDNFVYPRIAGTEFIVKADGTEKITLRVDWTLGEESYWQPNVPYREGYRAKLHILKLNLYENKNLLHTADMRFGFREIRQNGAYFELNGARINFRGDNLQVANYDRIDFGGKGDAVGTYPGFLPPSEDNPGWIKAVDNFLRLNYNVQREHMTPWTPYMIDVCDEMGLMLIGESACRWNGFDMENGRGFHEVKCLQDIIKRDKNHPSIVRWSSKNEPQCLDEDYHTALYDAIKEIDGTRPISEDVVTADWNLFNKDVVFKRLKDNDDFTWIDHYITYDGNGAPFFTSILHNDAVIPRSDRPYGLGEADWIRSSTHAGLAWFAATTALARAQDASDVRPYVLLSSWVSSIPGVKTTDLITEENRYPVYGEDNLPDPWSSSGIRLLQKACNPLLAFDYEFWKTNRNSNAMGHFPVIAPRVQANAKIEREITVFNDDLSGEEAYLIWELREGSLSNRIYENGETKLTITPGYVRKARVMLSTPVFNTFIFLTLKVIKNSELRFYDNLTCFEVIGGQDFSLTLSEEMYKNNIFKRRE